MNKRVFDETITNIFENFIPNKTLTCNNKGPPWMAKLLKAIFKGKMNFLETSRKELSTQIA